MTSAPLYQGHDQPRSPGKSLTSHKGLWFERFFDRYDREWKVEDTGKKTWIEKVTGTCGDTKALQVHSLSQNQLCHHLQGISKIFTNNWHFISGMGNNHPVENGMSWHPTLGTPYLTGASVKGLLRSWMEEWSDLEENTLKEKLHRWFGSDDKDPAKHQKEPQAGALIFFDALPVTPATLTCDIMTPHMGKWYADGADIQNNNNKKDQKGNYSDTLPADWHSPIPIPFLVVKQTSLQFIIAPRPQANVSPEELQLAMKMLTMALEYLGAGAKTAVGYGRFENDTNANQKLKKSRQEAARKDMKPEDRFADELINIDDKKLAEMFGKGFNKTKKVYEGNGCPWETIIKVLMDEKKAVITSWENADKNTAQRKAYKKLAVYLYTHDIPKK